MPFDDLKTPTMQPVAWAVPDRDDGEIWHVTMWRDEAIRAAGGNEFALIPLYTLGCRLSGVAAGVSAETPVLPSEFAAAADVAVPAEPRHDAATCCRERHVTECRPEDAGADETSQADVGDGWRDLRPDEILQDGDELNNGLWGWGESFRAGLKAGTEFRYRRRVTPEAKPVEIDGDKPAVGDGWRWLDPDEILQEGDEYYGNVNCGFVPTGDWGYSANHVGGAGLYRRRVTPVEPPLGACLDEENNELRQQVATLTAQVERLRLTEDERESVQRAAAFLTKLADRLGGGE